MTQWQMSILGKIIPDNTGRCYFDTYDNFASNDVWKHLVIVLQNPASSANHGFYGTFQVPMNYVANAAVVPIWTTTATTGNISYHFTYRNVTGNNTTSLDQTGSVQSVNATVSAPGAANRRMTNDIPVTNTNFSNGATIEFLFERRDNTANDTLAADVTLHDLMFQWSDV